MYKVTIPATTILNTQTYDVNCTYLCDETCRRFPFDEHGNFSYNETLSSSQNFNLDDAMRRIRYKLNELARNFNPWQFDIDLYSDPSHNTFGAVGNMFLNAMNITVHELPATEFTYDFSNGRSINAQPLTNGGSNPYANLDSQLRAGVVFYDGTPNCSFSYEMTFLPNDIFRSGMISEDTNNCVRFSISISAIKGQLPGTIERISGFSINAVIAPPFSTTTGQFYVAAGLIGQYMSDLNTEMLGGNSDSPYEVIPAGFGGGDGTFNLGSGTIDDPEIPTIDAVSTGLLTIFAPTLSQVQQLGDYMWSSAFDVDTLKKLFADPMQAIIGLSIVPIAPTLAGSKHVKIGDIDTGISMSYVTRQYCTKNMGSVSIDRYIGSFMDYAPYTKISIYLPYIGIRELNPDDVMGCTITVGYNIDILTGGVNAYINVSGKGCIYQYCGSAIQNVPLSAINYSGAIQNAISGVGSIATTVAGFASGNVALGGVGVMNLATQASNVASNLKPTIQRSGSMGGSSGLMSVQTPYMIIERPNVSTPNNFNHMWGNCTNVTMKLQDCQGFTMVDQIHLDNVICTEDERNELYKLLKEGVIL